jgi:Tol biopolymer transport system component
MPSISRESFVLAAALLVLLVVPLQAEETRFGDVRQLTHGGENAEAYWSPDGERLVFQRTGPEGGCDQIFVVPADGSGDAVQRSSGAGRTTCAYFLAGGERILYSTTGFADPGCPAPPDRSRGYVWPVYRDYEIVIQGDDGGDPVRLTDNDAYEAEATVCPADGSIVFTSDRDGDLELYRMDADGSNVRRLTEVPGYDGGAFFSPDCSRLVWRASRPRGADLEEYRTLLAAGLVRPSLLELWVADADGANARQITYLGAASFAPSFFPDGERIAFASNWHAEGGREFDLWAIDLQGTRLERITETPGFDGFPHVSPDGTRLAFATNRFPGGPYETNVAVATWVDHEPRYEERAADRYLADVRWLADDAREGRGAGTAGLAAAADWLEERFREIGLAPGYGESYRQGIEIPVEVRTEEGTRLTLDDRELTLGEEWSVTGFAASGAAAAEVVPAGYGIVASELERDD